MPVEAELRERDVMESDITVAPRTETRLDGKRTHGEPVLIQCHIERKRMEVRTAAGELALASGRCLCDDAYLWITEECELTLPNEGVRPITAVETTYGNNLDTGVNGPYQTYVYFT